MRKSLLCEHKRKQREKYTTVTSAMWIWKNPKTLMDSGSRGKAPKKKFANTQ